MRKIRVTAIGVAAVGALAVLTTNTFPDQAYALLQNLRGWANLPAGSSAPELPVPRATSVTAKSEKAPFVVLNGAVHLCSRRGPKVDGHWEATEQQIVSLESNLKRISSLRPQNWREMSITHPENCCRQYVPVIVSGRKLIYVNAFCGIEGPGWRTDFVTICDGGESVWGVLYDPTTEEFSELEINGRA